MKTLKMLNNIFTYIAMGLIIAPYFLDYRWLEWMKIPTFGILALINGYLYFSDSSDSKEKSVRFWVAVASTVVVIVVMIKLTL